VETLLFWNVNNSLYSPFFSCYLKTNRALCGRKTGWIELLCEFPVNILYRKIHLNIVADALSRREDYRPINSLAVLENKEIHDIAAYFCDADEKIPLELLSTMHRYSFDPRSKLLYFIRERKRELCIPRSPELMQLIMHEPHDVPFAVHPGFTKVYEDIRKLLYWSKMRKENEKYIKTCHRCQVNKHYRQVTSALSTGHLSTTSTDVHS
jgi:hypothetical protein